MYIDMLAVHAELCSSFSIFADIGQDDSVVAWWGAFTSCSCFTVKFYKKRRSRNGVAAWPSDPTRSRAVSVRLKLFGAVGVTDQYLHWNLYRQRIFSSMLWGGLTSDKSSPKSMVCATKIEQENLEQCPQLRRSAWTAWLLASPIFRAQTADELSNRPNSKFTQSDLT